MRWALLAIAIAVGACGRDKGDRASHSDAAVPADTTMATNTASADTSHAAMPADTAASKHAETSTKTASKSTPAKSTSGATTPAVAASGTTASPRSDVSGAQAMMGVVAAGAPKTLSKDQVKQLQAALRKQGCYSGTPDGMTGPGTQAAIECGLRKYQLTPSNMSGLYEKLGLKF